MGKGAVSRRDWTTSPLPLESPFLFPCSMRAGRVAPDAIASFPPSGEKRVIQSGSSGEGTKQLGTSFPL